MYCPPDFPTNLFFCNNFPSIYSQKFYFFVVALFFFLMFILFERMVKVLHVKTASMSLFDSDHKINNNHSNKNIRETLFTLQNLVSYSEMKKKRTTSPSPVIDHVLKKKEENDSPPSKFIKKIAIHFYYLNQVNYCILKY